MKKLSPEEKEARKIEADRTNYLRTRLALDKSRAYKDAKQAENRKIFDEELKMKYNQK